MNLRTRIRTAIYLIRRGDLPADVRQRIGEEIAEDDAFVDELLVALYEKAGEAAADDAIFAFQLGAEVADAFPTPRLTVLTGSA